MSHMTKTWKKKSSILCRISDRANHNYQLSQKEVEHLREQIKTGIENRPVSNTEKEFDVASLENESKERELVQLTTELAKTEEKHALQVSQLQKQIQGKLLTIFHHHWGLQSGYVVCPQWNT